jgi:hypothetical protein
LQIEDLRPKVEAFNVPERLSADLQQQQQRSVHQINPHHHRQLQQLPPPPLPPLPPLPPPPQQHFQQQNHLHQRPHQPQTFRSLDVWTCWRNLPGNRETPDNSRVNKLFEIAGLPPSSKISWIQPRDGNRDMPGKVAFAAVQNILQMDALIRFCAQNPKCVDGFEVEVQLSTKGRDLVPPPLCLKFYPAAPRPRSFIDRSDIIFLACAAGIPDPFSSSVTCDYPARDAYMGHIVYLVPAHAEELLAYCARNPKFSKQGEWWNLDCKYDISRRE